MSMPAWYLADIVEEITVEGDPRNVVHIKLTLVRAQSPDEAFDKAVALGLAGEMAYENTEGKRVTATFRGLRDLLAVTRDLEDGAELMYEELIGLPVADVEKLVSPKASLAAFSRGQPSRGPNYLDRDVVAEAENRFGVRFKLPDT